MSEIQGLQAVDYVVFIMMLVISVGIGVYHSLTGGKQRTTSEYLTGDRKLRYCYQHVFL